MPELSMIPDFFNWDSVRLTVSVVTLRLLMSWLHWPPFFYHSTLYDVHIFGDADSFFNGYLGDMLLNASLLLFAGACSRYLPAEGVLKKKRRVLLFWIVVDFLAL